MIFTIAPKIIVQKFTLLLISNNKVEGVTEYYTLDLKKHIVLFVVLYYF